MKAASGLLLALAVLCATNVEASPVIASASSSWTYDPGTQRYTYTYSVTNAANSPNHIETFGLHPVMRPISIVAPAGWVGRRGWHRDTTAVVWTIIDPGLVPPPTRLQKALGPNHIAPGETQGGFQLVSDHAPDSTATFVAQGFDTIPGGAHDPATQVPALKTLWEEGWSDAAIVPRLGGPVGVRPTPNEVAVEFYPPVPSPTKGSVDLSFVLRSRGEVEIALVDVAGRRVATVDKSTREVGPHRVTWNGESDEGKRVHGGVYFYRLKFNGKQVGENRVVVLP